MFPAIDRYAHLDSPLHAWDPRWKLASLGVLMAAMAIPRPVTEDPRERLLALSQVLVSFAISLGLVHISRIPLLFALRRLVPAALFLAVFTLLYPLRPVAGAASLWGAGAWSYDAGAVVSGGAISLGALSILLLVIPTFGTSRFDATMKALRALRVPSPLVHVVVFAYRYIYAYADEVIRLRHAMRSRGFRGRPLGHALRTLGHALGGLLVRSVERTEGIQRAMEARGFLGEFKTLDELETRPRDIGKCAAILAIAAVLVAWRFLPNGIPA